MKQQWLKQVVLVAFTLSVLFYSGFVVLTPPAVAAEYECCEDEYDCPDYNPNDPIACIADFGCWTYGSCQWWP